ncbi:MAG: hypothetical protein ACRETH_07600, partial [Steroidobacteraceae bacterium]
LYMQPFGVLEDDARDWSKAQRKLLTKSLAVTLQRQLKSHHEQINWDRVAALAHDPRGVPVPVSSADASLEQTLAAAPRVQNVLPQGSTWDGKTDLPMDEASFKQILSEIEPKQTVPEAAAAPGGPGSASAGKTSAPSTVAPKDGGR